jgi:hypothetical protein
MTVTVPVTLSAGTGSRSVVITTLGIVAEMPLSVCADAQSGAITGKQAIRYLRNGVIDGSPKQATHKARHRSVDRPVGLSRPSEERRYRRQVFWLTGRSLRLSSQTEVQ